MAILLTFVDSGFKPTTANEWAVAEAVRDTIPLLKDRLAKLERCIADIDRGTPTPDDLIDAKILAAQWWANTRDKI
jgi:hypothetical protein